MKVLNHVPDAVGGLMSENLLTTKAKTKAIVTNVGPISLDISLDISR